MFSSPETSQALVTPDIYREASNVSATMSAAEIDRRSQEIFGDFRALMAGDDRSAQLRAAMQAPLSH